MNTSSLAILMCVYNGSNFIQAQLDSILNQTFINWNLFIYDDASTDDTAHIVQNFAYRCKNRCHFIQNKERLGYTKNFLKAIRETPKNFDFFAFSDHDDIFLPSKLEDAIAYLEKQSQAQPCLFYTSSLLIDANDNIIGASPKSQQQPSFRNAFFQSIYGNTSVINKAAIQILTMNHPKCSPTSHDWWMYLLISAVGGHIHYEKKPSLLYRQHSQNAIGSVKTNFKNRLVCFFNRFFDNKFKLWIDCNIEALKPFCSSFTPENRCFFETFLAFRQMPFYKRVFYIFKLRPYRQTKLDTIALYLAAIFNKL